tara:strand:- start:617 stop:790 length:174 start_codon:yes stop_codon:yes gene_type:complete
MMNTLLLAPVLNVKKYEVVNVDLMRLVEVVKLVEMNPVLVEVVKNLRNVMTDFDPFF